MGKITESLFYAILVAVVVGAIIMIIEFYWFNKCFPDCPVWFFGNASGSEKGIDIDFMLSLSLLAGASTGFFYLLREKIINTKGGLTKK